MKSGGWKSGSLKTGWVILALSLRLIFASCDVMAATLNWNQDRGYEDFRYATNEGILIDNHTDTLQYDYFKLPSSCQSFYMRFRSCNMSGNPGKKYSYYDTQGKEYKIRNPHWGFFVAGSNDTVIFTLKGGEKSAGPETERSLVLEIYNCKSRQKEVTALSKGINPYEGDNLWQLETGKEGIPLKGGDTSLNDFYKGGFSGSVTGFGFYAGWGDKILISDITSEYKERQKKSEIDFNEDILEDYLKESQDPMEGYWVIFDRELEEDQLKLGGDYRLICLKNGEEYLMYYLEGARVNSKEWLPGDVKLKLCESSFEGIYDVEWQDAMKSPLRHDVKAQIGEGDTLLIQFPYQSSKLRLRKIIK